jgi:hypothetical protein
MSVGIGITVGAMSGAEDGIDVAALLQPATESIVTIKTNLKNKSCPFIRNYSINHRPGG